MLGESEMRAWVEGRAESVDTVLRVSSMFH